MGLLRGACPSILSELCVLYNLVVFVFVFISVFCPCVWRQLPEELGLTGPLYLGHIVLLFCLGFVFYVVFLFDRAFLRRAYRILFWLCIFYFVLYFSLTGPLYLRHIAFCLGVVFC